ncbi:hypothetical protein SRHO_G00181640 [Serrasalmus rhombeus]
MEPIVQVVSSAEGSLPRKVLKAAPRGASTHFVGSTIVILSSYAVATLAMNCGKKLQEQRLKPEPIVETVIFVLSVRSWKYVNGCER